MLDRTQAPAIHPIDSVPTIGAEKVFLSPTLTAHVLHSILQPVIRLDVVFPAGRWYEPSEGVAHLASKMLLEGTTQHSAAEIAELISFYGASITCQATGDWSTLTLHCLAKHFEPLLQLINELLQEASFSEDEFKQLKTRTSQSIQVERQKNNYLATEALTGKVFGTNHPYQTGMKPANIEQADLQQVKSFFHSHYLTAASHIFIAGDVNDSHLNFLKELASGQVSELIKPTYALVTDPALTRIATANNLQASIQLGRICPHPGTSEYFQLQILNEALGGYFGSRLMKNIREEKGFTYGVFSQLVPRKEATLWNIRTDVNSENADKAYAEVEAEFTKLTEEAIGSEELNAVQSSLLGKFLTERATIFDQLEWYKFQVLYNLSDDYFAQYSNVIQTTKAKDLQELAKSYLQIQDWSAVIVGP